MLAESCYIGLRYNGTRLFTANQIFMPKMHTDECFYLTYMFSGYGYIINGMLLIIHTEIKAYAF